MHKILYVACVNLDDEVSGITRKVLAQYAALSSGSKSMLIGYCGDSLRLINNGSIVDIATKGKHRRIAIMEYAVQLIKEESFDCVYIRRFPCNPLVLQMLYRMKKNGAQKILWEIPTYPYDFELGNRWKARIIGSIDCICRKWLNKYIDRIVTFAPEREIFGIPTIQTGNGIDVDSVRVRKVDDHGNELHLVAAAVLNNWHGYDRLIRGLAEYTGERKVVFHLIGEGSCYAAYKVLAKELNVEDSVVFYGSKTKSEVEDIYDICDMAVESLGWHRSQVTMGTSLKTREYVAKGMPILASTPMDIFPDGWEYAYYAPIDDSAINIQAVVEFYSAITAKKDIKEFAEEIRQIAYERCDMKAMMKPIIDFYNMDDVR